MVVVMVSMLSKFRKPLLLRCLEQRDFRAVIVDCSFGLGGAP
jgi:hypothetical protein